MELRIVPLTEEMLEAASEMALKSFDTIEGDDDYAPFWFNASLNPEQAIEEYKKFDLKWLQYWLAVDASDKIIGSVGLYERNEDGGEAYWVAWFGVLPEMRRKGVGKKLLEFVIEITRNAGKKYLRLYTSTSPQEETAQMVYEKNGFKETGREKFPHKRNTTIYRELEL